MALPPRPGAYPLLVPILLKPAHKKNPLTHPKPSNTSTMELVKVSDAIEGYVCGPSDAKHGVIVIQVRVDPGGLASLHLGGQLSRTTVLQWAVPSVKPCDGYALDLFR